MNLPVATPAHIESAENQAEPALELTALIRAIQAADPRALLVLPRILRRVIKQDCKLTGWTFRVPHRKTYVIARDRLLEIVDPDELELAPGAVLPDQLILLPRPEPEKLAALTAAEALIRYWRLLFHARVHVALQQALDQRRLTPAIVGQRIQQLGTVEFDEIRTVLQHETYLLPPRDDTAVYVEFAAVFLEFRYFVPSLLPRFFPALQDLDAVEHRLLAQDVNGAELFAATRLAGAPEPADPVADDAWDDQPDAEAASVDGGLPVPNPSPHEFRRLLRRAESAASVGNTVRSLIYHARALQHAVGDTAVRTRVAIHTGLDRLLQRLQRALQIPQEELKAWREPLAALVHQTPRRFWPPESRFLYDLQKVCVDHERGVYTVDLAEWIRTLGRRPIKRALPNQREVLISKHLQTAAARLHVVRLPAAARRQLSVLLHTALEQAEQRLRLSFRPLLREALDAVGLRPAHTVERVAQQKIVEELLDRIVERGYLAMGDLRDALSRNNLKLPDLHQPQELLRGDPLLRADRRLATSLDGVHRRGEFYLRWMQQLSSIGFGTQTGRWLTRFLVIPFGGAYVVLAFAEHLLEMFGRTNLELHQPWAVALVGGLLLGLVNVAWFRQRVWQGLAAGCRTAREMLLDPIVALVRSEFVQRILHSRAYVLVSRLLVRPLVLTSAIYWLSPLELEATRASLAIAASVFLTVNLAINSRLGRTAEEVFLEWIVRSWHRFGLRVLAGLYWLVVDLFRGLLESLERLLYTVDEWLRFRTGETSLTFTAKAVLGAIWFVVSYVTRFLVNLIIEPQVNPIKHFPTVTVGHKLIIIFVPALGDLLILTCERLFGVSLEKGLAYTIAWFTIAGIPGIFGFLVWELKENWRLYAANRPAGLQPVPVGRHGETMARLLRPGFHSGTLPKQFAALRRADRKARTSGNWNAVRKHLHALESIQRAIRRYVERELLALLAQSAACRALGLTVAALELGSNRVRMVLECPSLDAGPATLEYDVEAGWLLATVAQPGWLDRLDNLQRPIVFNALAGLYQTSAVELVREQVQSLLRLPEAVYWLTEEALVVRPNPASAVEVYYPLPGTGPYFPHTAADPATCPMPFLLREELFFSAVAIRWSDWCEAWQLAATGDDCPQPLTAAKIFPDG